MVIVPGPTPSSTDCRMQDPLPPALLIRTDSPVSETDCAASHLSYPLAEALGNQMRRAYDIEYRLSLDNRKAYLWSSRTITELIMSSRHRGLLADNRTLELGSRLLLNVLHNTTTRWPNTNGWRTIYYKRMPPRYIVKLALIHDNIRFSWGQSASAIIGECTGLFTSIEPADSFNSVIHVQPNPKMW